MHKGGEEGTTVRKGLFWMVTSELCPERRTGAHLEEGKGYETAISFPDASAPSGSGKGGQQGALC